MYYMLNVSLAAAAFSVTKRLSPPYLNMYVFYDKFTSDMNNKFYQNYQLYCLTYIHFESRLCT